MDFKNVCINGISYGEKQNMSQKELDKYTKVTNVDFRENDIFSIIKEKSVEFNKVHENQLCLSLCHTIITEQLNGQINYNASSPDELALVNFAKFTGYEYIGTDENNFMSVKVGS